MHGIAASVVAMKMINVLAIIIDLNCMNLMIHTLCLDHRKDRRKDEATRNAMIR